MNSAGERMIAPTASMNPTVVTTGPEFGLDLGRPISAVGEHIIAGVARVQQPIQLLAVVHGNGRRVGIPWVRWVSGCAMAEHPFMPVRTSFHRLSRGGNTRRIVGAPWCNGMLHGATVRQQVVGFAFCA